MAIGSFVSGMTEGVFQGMDWRAAREDRKRRTKLDDEDRDIAKQDRDLRLRELERQRKLEDEKMGVWREENVYTNEERKRKRKEEDRALKLRDAEAAAWDEFFTGKTGGTVPGGATAAAPSDPYAVPESGTPLTYGDMAPPQVASAEPQRTAPPSIGPAGVRLPAQTPNPSQASALTVPPVTPDPRPLPVPQTAADTPIPRDPSQRPQREESAPPSSQQGSLMDQAIDATLANARSAPPPQAQPAPPPQGRPALSIMEAVAERGMPQAARDRWNVKQAQGPDAPVQGMADYRGSGPIPTPAVAAQPATMAPPAGPAMPSASPDQPPVVDAAPPAPARAPAEQAAAAIPSTPAGTPMVSAAVAAETAPAAPGKGKLAFGVLGKDGAVKATKAEYASAAKAGTDAYITEQAPKLIEFYLRNGEFEKAAAFEKFIADKKTKQGIGHFMKAAHALNIGDEKTALDSIAAAYNTYYDDGFQALPGESDLTYDDNGTLTGGTLVFKNTETGEIFKEEFTGSRELMVSVLGAISPEGTFDALSKALVGGSDELTDNQKTVFTAAMRELGAANDALLDQTQRLPIEEMTARALAIATGKAAPAAAAGAAEPILPD